MRICYLTRNYKTARHAGGKARQDMEELMRRHGCRNLGIPTTRCRNKVTDFFLTLLGVLAYTLRLRRGDVVVLQYPVKKYFRYLCRLARMRGAKTVTLVHDLGSFRRHRLTPGEEVRKLSLTDALIISNEAEIGWLRDHGCRVPMTPQVAWDYLADSKPQHVPDPEEAVAHPSLMYVGNVRRKANGFLYKVKGLPMHLYGMGDVLPDDTHFLYGHTLDSEIIRSATASFAVVWYGGSLDCTDGFIGEYIRYCNTHKLSLYMRCHRPVIISNESGMAPFVRREGIGLTVDTLEGIAGRLAAVTAAEYGQMQRNVERVSALMAEGHYFYAALDRALSRLPDAVGCELDLRIRNK